MSTVDISLVSEYGKKKGYVDLAALSTRIKAIPCNKNILSTIPYWEIACGSTIYYKDEYGTYSDTLYYDQPGYWVCRIGQLNNGIKEYKNMLAASKEQHEREEIMTLMKKCESELQKCERNLQMLTDNEYEYDFIDYYIIDYEGCCLLSRYTEETVFYNYQCDMYIWAIKDKYENWPQILTLIECPSE